MKVYTKIVFIAIFCMFLNSFGISSSIFDYIISGFIILIYLANLKKINLKIGIFDIVPIVFLTTWFYGFLIGLFNGSTFYNAIFNFPGMLLLALYFPFKKANLSISELGKLVFYPTLLLNSYVLSIILSGNFVFSSSSFIDSRQYYSVGLILQVIVFSFVFIRENDLKNLGIKNYLIWLNATISLLILILSFSKGFWLSLSVSIFLIIGMSFVHYLIKRKIVIKNVLLILFIPSGICLFLISNPDIFDGIILFFSSDATGNALRNEQAKYLSDEFTIFGSGFGIPLKSGYMRDENGYSFELSYYNFIHKVGIFSFGIFFTLLYVVYYSIKNFIVSGPQPIFVISISSLTFLISASGNPLLFSSINIVILTLILTQFSKYDFK